jgi:hypothetical protein
MLIQEWAAIAEIVSAVAVIASLIYLAMQIRQNTHGLEMSLKSTELAAFERNVETGNRMREIFILNSEVAELYAQGMKSYRDLDDSDRLRFGMILSNVFSALQGAYVRQLPNDRYPASNILSRRKVTIARIRITTKNTIWRCFST